MPTTQKSPQKHTKATQKVGGSANPKPKKPVTKAMEGGKAAPSKGKMTRGGSAKSGGISISEKMPVTKKTMNEAINEIEKTIQYIDSKIDLKIYEFENTIRAIYKNLYNDKQSKIRKEIWDNKEENKFG
jgi:hypothetical protein